MKDWAKKLKVGDKVIVTTNLRDERISVVQGITPKGFIRVDGMLFYQDGSQRTTSWYYSHIEEYTEEKVEKMRQQHIIDEAFGRMRCCNKDKIDYAMAVKILQILAPEKKYTEDKDV